MRDYQQRVARWMLHTFGDKIAADKIERNRRFLEEAIELAQACECTKEHAHQLVNYVYGRPKGEQVQEIGGVMVTLAALCSAQGLDLQEAANVEADMIWLKSDAIREKHATKPLNNSPLPGPGVAPAPVLSAPIAYFDFYPNEENVKGMINIAPGDSVFHRPTRETWYVIRVDRSRSGGVLYWGDWPQGCAPLSECLLVHKGGEEHD